MNDAKDDEYHADHVLRAQDEQLFALFKIIIKTLKMSPLCKQNRLIRLSKNKPVFVFNQVE